ncbi:outer membrane protein transport protein [Antarcticibacterium sp. 1MA-6-2]|uniref:outer membrane protein transport protein n=1 Tax=Antarcticibacterium sp. 1MA-6-2 TaxID=2908210 RepID=UPI001F2870CF|nr:outer membrane protein transport protein [Antarcticibacterium sp. 1MA-6-2]UJH89692.1 outer membrane protein transport protein [Antarcticibacterium sp. 1MA-6-2]
MDEENAFNKFTLGVNYSQTQNFNDNFIAKGTGTSSIDNYFLGYADGIPLELLETVENETVGDLYSYLGENEGFGAQQAFLGYQGYILNPNSNDPANTQYTSTIAPGSFNQNYSYLATGLNGKFSFNFASEFNNFLYLGANLNAHFLNYDRITNLFETNTNAGSETNEVVFSNNLSTAGNGFSLQVGTIAKVSENFRVGVSYETPTWFTISEKTTQRLETYSTELDDLVLVEPNIVNLYPDYKLKTPGKITGSVAILFGTTGLLSFDYSHKDYSSTELRPAGDPEFMYQNNLISQNLKAASTYKVGGEYRISRLSLRGGYRFEESPYKNEMTIGNLEGYSAEFGI